MIGRLSRARNRSPIADCAMMATTVGTNHGIFTSSPSPMIPAVNQTGTWLSLDEWSNWDRKWRCVTSHVTRHAHCPFRSLFHQLVARYRASWSNRWSVYLLHFNNFDTDWDWVYLFRPCHQRHSPSPRHHSLLARGLVPGKLEHLARCIRIILRIGPRFPREASVHLAEHLQSLVWQSTLSLAIHPAGL